MKVMNAYQLDDFQKPSHRLLAMENYYLSGRIPLTEMPSDNCSPMAAIQYLVLESYTPRWHHRKMRPLHVGDLMVLTDSPRVIAVWLLSEQDGILLPAFNKLRIHKLIPCELNYEDLYERQDLAIPYC